MKFSRLKPLRGAGTPNVDFDNDRINDVVIVETGMAKGHGVWLDEKFIRDVVSEGQDSAPIKSRYGHPNMCSNSLGDYIGAYENFRYREKDGKHQAIADLQLDRDVADKSPKYSKSLTDYILEFASKRPEMFGNSIVFSGIREERKVKDEKGEKVTRSFMVLKKGGFNASDVVDDPAATSGMFSEFNIANTVTEFLQNSELDVEQFESLLEDDAFIEFAEMLLNNHKVAHRILNIMVNKKEIVQEFKSKIEENKEIDLAKVAAMFDEEND